MSPIEIALSYIAHGWAPIPIPHKSKRPVGEGWQNLRVTTATAQQYFNGLDQNIGVLMGEASGGLVDVDLDCLEATIAAPGFLPQSRTFGRKSKRGSHWLFKTDLPQTEDVATIKFSDVARPAKVILEIRIGGRGRGAQTVFPGSVHPSGEAIEWEDLHEVARIDGKALRIAGARISACVLLARAYPSQGGRHEGAIIVAGFLCRCGWAGPDIKLFVDVLANVTCQPLDKRRDMVRAAVDTAQAFAAGRNTFGLPKMSEVFGEAVAKKCVEWLGYRAEVRGANGGRANTFRNGEADGFVRGEKGQILDRRPHNVRRAIELLGIRLRKNEFSGQTELEGLPGTGHDLTDAGATRLRFLVEETYGFLPLKELFEDVLIDLAYQNRFHPVRDYLDGLVWDEIPRIDSWLSDHAGAENTPFNRAIGRIFLIAAVRRVRCPGCKFDTMIVFESPVEGKNKSSAVRLLAKRDEWFNDNLPLGASPQEVIEQISGSWIIEFPELAGLATREIEHIKAFLSRQTDKARPAYGRRREDFKRQFVACGTTNDDEYLKNDARRFWPVKIELFMLSTLEPVVDQLWAEAAHYEQLSEPITLAEDLWPDAAEARDARRLENPYRSILARRFGNVKWVSSTEVWECVGVPAERRVRECKAVGMAMRDLGFTRKQERGSTIGKPGLVRGEYFYERL